MGRVVVTPRSTNLRLGHIYRHRKLNIGDIRELGEPCPCGADWPCCGRSCRERDTVMTDLAAALCRIGMRYLAEIREVVQFRSFMKSICQTQVKLVNAWALDREIEDRIRHVPIMQFARRHFSVVSHIRRIRESPAVSTLMIILRFLGVLI